MIKPMLAKPFLAKRVKGDIFIQPKLNGQRAVWDGKKLWTRTGKQILSVPTIEAELREVFDNIPLDGELYIHGMSLQQIMKYTRPTKKINEHPDMKYHVYDMPVKKLTFRERWADLTVFKKLFKHCDHIVLVPTQLHKQYKIEDLNIHGPEGYEGTMVRLAEGLYKFGKRSGDLMKIKDFLDDEFEIVGITPLSRKEKIELDAWEPGALARSSGKWYRNGKGTEEEMVGSLICVTSDGQKFEVGTGLDDATREDLWKNPPIGKMLTVKYQNLTDTGIPFTPVFIAIRDYE